MADKYKPGRLERDFALVSACSGVPMEALQECDVEDVGKIRGKSIELHTWFFTGEEPPDREEEDENPTSATEETSGAE